MTEVALELGEVTLRATVTGAGPTVLLLHAGEERRGVWAPVAERLTTLRTGTLRTVAVDQRGHGDSPGPATTLREFADDVIAMVAREPAPVVIVGASLGGLAAIAALADPDTARRVAGLVLVDVVPGFDPARVRSWLDERGLRDRHPELVADIFAAGPELLATAGALELPILLVRGERSPLHDVDEDRLRAANPRVTTTHVPGAGHLVASDAPAELARIVAEHATTWFAFDLQRTLGAERMEHPGGTLLAHLRRVHALAVDWNASPRTRLAAICHASYGTDGFRHALLPVTDRQRLRSVIGADAEALVYLYGACDRSRTYPELGRTPLPTADRFTAAASTIDGADLHDFAVLTIVNELDVARHAQLSAQTRAGIRDLVTSLASYAPQEAERAVADPALAG
jgi:pimeloyl-ACP methyl ester carboxylesterase